MAVVRADGAGPGAKPGIADTLEEAKAALASRYEQVKRGE